MRRSLTLGNAVPVRWSDHKHGTEVALAAMTLGIEMIQKNLTLDRTLPNPLHAASLEPNEFEQLVSGIRTVEALLRSGQKQPTEAGREIAAVACMSLVAARLLGPRHLLAGVDFLLRRPGITLPSGMRPHDWRPTARAVEEGALTCE